MRTSEEIEYPSLPRIVLVVHDVPDLIEVYERVLDQEGDEFWLTGSTMDEAVEYARDLRPDVILCDVSPHPETVWEHFLRDLSRDPQLRHTPVLLLVASDPSAESTGRATAVLMKPVEPETLLATVRDAADRAPVWRAPSMTMRQAISAAISRRARRASG